MRSHSAQATTTNVTSVSTSNTNNANTNTQASTNRYAYDRAGRRVLAQEGITEQSDVQTSTRRTAYQPGSHRWLGEQVASTSNNKADNQAQMNQAQMKQPISYTPNGQPSQVGQRQYAWVALGRLTEIRQEAKPLARYTYNHRGERIAKTISNQTSNKTSSDKTTHYLYEAGQLTAELNQDGQITRQYLYLADQPIAVIDTPDGKPLQKAELSAPESLGLDAQNIIKYWVETLTSSSSSEQISYLHTNHLGAPEAATDKQGQVIWQASYAPFGAAQIVKTSLSDKAISNPQSSFDLNIRLPGQYLDAETGLHYNKQRYYDPARGEYLTPDPMGTPDGPNPYSYVRYNPLKYVDPDGLILFAFDGTGNDETSVAAATNVVRFRQAYTDSRTNYVTGVGTDHSGRDTYGDIISSTYNSGLIPDRGGNYSGPDRIKRMRLYFDDEAEAETDDNKAMQVDIIGFSRGASQARDFANKVTAATSNGYYKYQAHKRDGTLSVDAQGKAIMRCQKVNFRFMGLWDTVLATNRSGYAYQLGIPADFKYVAQAVALNEYRSAPAGNDAFATANTNFRLWDHTRVHLMPNNDHYGGFQLESIGASSNANGRTRIERGFLGAHADIGGGYATNNTLSAVALSWMVGQAQTAGVAMNVSNISVGTNDPVVHDQSNALRVGDPRTVQQFRVQGTLFGTNQYPVEDRVVSGGLGGGTQRTQTFGPAEAGGNRSLTNADIDTERFITYTPRNFQANDTRRTTDIDEVRRLNNETGTVNMQAYMSWLRGHGYAFAGLNQ